MHRTTIRNHNEKDITNKLMKVILWIKIFNCNRSRQTKREMGTRRDNKIETMVFCYGSLRWLREWSLSWPVTNVRFLRIKGNRWQQKKWKKEKKRKMSVKVVFVNRKIPYRWLELLQLLRIFFGHFVAHRSSQPRSSRRGEGETNLT